jgi:hypothetical protein
MPCDLCHFPTGFSFQDQNELCWPQDLDALIFFHVREMLRIATHQIVSFPLHRSLDKHIIVWISLHNIQALLWCHQFPERRKARNYSSDLFVTQSEPVVDARIGEDLFILQKDRI